MTDTLDAIVKYIDKMADNGGLDHSECHELADRIRAQCAQTEWSEACLKALMKAQEEWCAERVALNAKIADLRLIANVNGDWTAKCANLQADAARYRWLRDNATVLIPEAFLPSDFPEDDWTPEQLDAAIDAAIKAGDKSK